MFEEVDLSRRNFVLAGATVVGSASALGRAAAQTTETRFQDAAVLIGPARARPDPGDSFFDNKIAYTYIYRATDDVRDFTITEDTDNWQLLSGRAYPLADTISSDTTIRERAHIWRVDASGGPVTLTIGTELEVPGTELVVKKVGDSALNDVTVTAESGKSIDGSSSQTVSGPFGVGRFFYDSVYDQWWTG